MNTNIASRCVFRFSKYLERIASHAQGKGYGSSTITQEINAAYSLLKSPPNLAIDIGGNVGDYSAEIIRRNPGAEIHIFEPSKTNIRKLQDRFGVDKSVKICPFAVSDKAGSATLFSDAHGSGLASLTKRRLNHFNIDFDVKESVDTVRFEDYWAGALNKRNLDLVKIDIEGNELPALQGFGDAIRATKVLQFEFGGCNIDTRTYFQDFWYFFKEHNFDIFRITPFAPQKIERYLEADEFFSTTNYVAVNRRLA